MSCPKLSALVSALLRTLSCSSASLWMKSSFGGLVAAPVPRQVISHSLSLTLDLSQLVCGVPPSPEGPSDWLSVSTIRR